MRKWKKTAHKNSKSELKYYEGNGHFGDQAYNPNRSRVYSSVSDIPLVRNALAISHPVDFRRGVMSEQCRTEEKCRCEVLLSVSGER